jgi:hypothetical protein
MISSPFVKILNFLRKKKAQRSILFNKELEKEFFTNGFFTLPLLNEDEILACKEVYTTSDLKLSSSKYNTLEVEDFSNREFVHNNLNQILKDKINQHLIDYTPFAYNFAVKKANSPLKFDAHIDDIHADETLHVGINIWIPLVDVDDENGGLYMVKASHKLEMPIRGIGLPFPFEEQKNLIEERSKPIHLKAGTAIFFHSKIIHGSPQNRSTQDRPAIIIGMLPSEATPIVYMQHSEIGHHEVELFATAPDFYNRVVIGQRPDFAKSLGVFKYENSKNQLDELLKLL